LQYETKCDIIGKTTKTGGAKMAKIVTNTRKPAARSTTKSTAKPGPAASKAKTGAKPRTKPNAEVLSLSDAPLAAANARPILVQGSDGVYIGLKPAGGPALPFEHMLGGANAGGILKIVPMRGKTALPYELTRQNGLFGATLSVENGKGFVEFAVDVSTNSLRIEARGVSHLQLSGLGGNTAAHKDGAEVNSGGRLYLQVAKGKFTFDDTWVLNRWSNVPPLMEIDAAAGKIELACFELPADTNPPKLTKSLSECVKENEKAFKAFEASLQEHGHSSESLSAYKTWIEPPKTSSDALADYSYLFSDEASSKQTILAAANAWKPGETPNWVLALNRFIDIFGVKQLNKSDVALLSGAIGKSVDWWSKNRYDTQKGLFYFAYPKEAGLPNGAFNGPSYAPELRRVFAQVSIAAAALKPLSGTLPKGDGRK
jgi:hypothetical protein